MAEVNDDYKPEGFYGFYWRIGMPRHEFSEEGFCVRTCSECGFPCRVFADEWESRCAADDGCDPDEHDNPWS